MTGILLSLIPLITWGAGDYIAAKGARNTNTYSLNMFLVIIGTLFIVPIALCFGTPALYGKEIVLFLIASLFFNGGFLTMLNGFKYGPTGIVAPIANSYALITTIISIVLLGDTVVPATVVGIMVIVAGIGLVSYSKPKAGEFKDLKRTLVSSILALFIFGIGFSFLGEASTQNWYQNVVLAQLAGVVNAFFIWLILQRKNRLRDFRTIAKQPLYYIGGIIGGVGLLGMSAAFQYSDSIAIPTAIGAAAPLVTALLAYKIDHEHLTLTQRFATLLIVGGIVTLAL